MFTASLPFYLRKKQFDVWIESFTPPFSTSFIPLYTQKPVIGLAHMLAAEDMQRKYKLPFSLVENKGLKQYRECIVVTEYMKQQVQRINPQCHISVIPNGIDLPHLVPSTTDQPFILFLGRIEVNQKGLDLLLGAYAQVQEQLATPLLIAGSGTDREMHSLRILITKYGLRDKVSLLGRVNTEQKNALLAEAQYVVMPSRFESFGVVALEAFSFAKPVIAFNLDMLDWIPGIAAIKVAPFDETVLAEALVRLNKEKHTRTTMGKAARALAEQCTWDKVAEQYREVIDQIIQKTLHRVF
jgi:glycosyltransferase involved in cell wall biosynthesis